MSVCVLVFRLTRASSGNLEISYSTQPFDAKLFPVFLWEWSGIFESDSPGICSINQWILNDKFSLCFFLGKITC